MPPRGNPDWGKPRPPLPAVPTEFELEAKRLRLTPDTYITSRELYDWCMRNRNRCYVPEWLLKKWHLDIDAELTS